MASAIALFLLSFTEVPSSWQRDEAPVFYITVQVGPTSGAYRLPLPARPYTATVMVHEEPGSRRVWGTEKIELAAGESDEKTSKLGNLTLRFRVSIAKDARTATTTVIISRDDKVLTHQRSIVSLRH